MSSFPSRRREPNTEDIQRRVYEMMFDSLSEQTDGLERCDKIPRDVADDLVFFHDPANLGGRYGREVEKMIAEFSSFVDNEIYRTGRGDIRVGDCHKRDLDDAVAVYLERAIRGMINSRNTSRSRDGGWQRGESFSRRSGTVGRGLLTQERSDRGWRSPMTRGNAAEDGNPLRRDDDRRRPEPIGRVEREPARPVRPEPTAGAAAMRDFVEEIATDVEPLTFVDVEPDATPAALRPDNLNLHGVRLEALKGSQNSGTAAFALRARLSMPIAAEQDVLTVMEPITRSLGKYLVECKYDYTQVLHIPQSQIATIKEAIGSKDPRDTAGLYWREIDETLDAHLKTNEKKQVDALITDEVNKRLVTFLRDQKALDWTVTLPNIAAIGQLIELDPIPAEVRGDLSFTNWINGTLNIVLNELFSAKIVTGNAPADKAYMAMADGTFYHQGKTLTQAAVDTDPQSWSAYATHYRKHRTVIVRTGSLTITNLGTAANWDRGVFDIEGTTQSNTDFWSAYSEEDVVGQKMAEIVRQGQKSIYLEREKDGHRSYRKFDLIWAMKTDSAPTLIVRHGYRHYESSRKSLGKAIVD